MANSRFGFLRSLATQLLGLTMCSMAIGSMPIQDAPAADDAYLKALEVEAQKSAKVSKKPQRKKSSVNTEFKIQFEQALENERPATYKFYTKLPDHDKNSVLDSYRQSKKISTASKKIFDLYFKMLKK